MNAQLAGEALGHVYDRKLNITLFPDVRPAEFRVVEATWSEAVQWLELIGESPKDQSELIKLATLSGAPNAKGCVRYDDAVTSICGIECDYDRGELSIDAAADLLAAAGIKCLLVPTHSYTEEKQRYRILAPTSCDLPPAARAGLVARVNGVLGGVLAGESFALSQSFYVGRAPGADYFVIDLDGEYIDLLDLPEVGVQHRKTDGTAKGSHDGTLEELLVGEDLHGCMLKFVNKRVARQWSDEEIRSCLRGVESKLCAARGVERVQALMGAELDRALSSAREKGFDLGAAAPVAKPSKPLADDFGFGQFSLSGKSKNMRDKMLDEVLVLDPVALVGQATVLYAQPNAGKTLLTLHMLCEAVEAGRVDGKKVFYINADDSYTGLVQKLEIAEECGFHMLAPGHGEPEPFRAKDFAAYLEKVVSQDAAHGMVLVLDTLKKFTDLMDKRVSATFMNVAREFVSHGGTLIMLAHVNKNRDSDGKLVMGGTSDVPDDVDCVYVIDTADSGNGLFTALFDNRKARGAVPPQVAFSFTRTEGEGYLALLDSVARIGNVSAAKAKVAAAAALEANADAIHAICHALSGGPLGRAELLEATDALPRRKVIKALKSHTGTDYARGHRWQVITGDKNKQQFELLETALAGLMKSLNQ